MIDVIDLPPRAFFLGDQKNIGVKNLRLETGAAWTPTGTVVVYDSAGSATLTSTALTISGTARLSALYRLTTGVGKNITVDGKYRAFYTITNGSDVQKWQQEITIRPVPD